ncbi:MAG: major capsid protein [Arizlama microvirus]|nr:MAG: major capsid protein [Arizlama microvirus]
MLAPVLPGETFERALLQSRVVTDPIKHPLIGWWLEYYFFYVRFRDLTDYATLIDMLLDPTASLSSLFSGDDTATYHEGSTTGINWALLCRNRVVEEYFREEGDDHTLAAALMDSEPLASIGQESGLQSVINDADYVSENPSLTVGGDGLITGREIAETLNEWQLEREQDLADATYGEWLGHYGVKGQDEDASGPTRPELIRYVKEWTYPSNTIDPSNGTPRSACSWAVQERIDKRRFLREPGFIFGVTVTRPKVYLSKQTGSLASALDFAEAWMPWTASVDPVGAGMRKFAATSGPLSTNTDAYWLDVRDLFLYGDQFVNFALSATDAGLVALPTAALQRRYVQQTDLDGLFVTSGTDKVKHDGVVQMSVKTSIWDRTPRSVP